MAQKIGILTSGGDCPGLNAAIRGVGKTAIRQHGMEVIGFINGFQGLVGGEHEVLSEEMLSGILTLGGTILGTSREKPFKAEPGDPVGRKQEQIAATLAKLGLDCVVCIGGNGTMKTAYKLAKTGVNVIGVPKTIDNDVWGTDFSFGYDSALGVATEAIDRLHTTANSHRRIMVVEVMGHGAGWLALSAGLASGGDVVLIPEIAWSEESVARTLKARSAAGKSYSIVVVAEGIALPPVAAAAGMGAGRWVAKRITELTGLETRETILGYTQRGGSPSPMDRILASRLGAAAAELIAAGQYGRMVAIQGNEITSIPLKDTAGRVKTVPPDHALVGGARLLGTSFGD
jgi:6-phosphofructokinase 1